MPQLLVDGRQWVTPEKRLQIALKEQLQAFGVFGAALPFAGKPLIVGYSQIGEVVEGGLLGCKRCTKLQLGLLRVKPVFRKLGSL